MRVILDRLVDRIERLRSDKPEGRVLIGIAGPPGAGKSTLSSAVAGRIGQGCAHLPMDGFHLADAALDLLGLRDRKGAPETFDAEGFAALLARVAHRECVWAPAFERTLEQPIAQSIRVGEEASVVVTEGNYLLLPEPRWQAARSAFDEVWFCDLDDAVRRERLVHRHVGFGKSPDQARAWVERVDEPNAALVQQYAHLADLHLDMGTFPAP